MAQLAAERDALAVSHRTDRERLLAERDTAVTSVRAEYEAALTRYQQERDAQLNANRADRERLQNEREAALRAQLTEARVGQMRGQSYHSINESDHDASSPLTSTDLSGVEK